MFLRSARHMAIPGISTNDREQRQSLRVTPRVIDTRAVKIVGRDSVSNLGRFSSVEDRRNAQKKKEKKGGGCILRATKGPWLPARLKTGTPLRNCSDWFFRGVFALLCLFLRGLRMGPWGW